MVIIKNIYKRIWLNFTENTHKNDKVYFVLLWRHKFRDRRRQSLQSRWEKWISFLFLFSLSRNLRRHNKTVWVFFQKNDPICPLLLLLISYSILPWTFPYLLNFTCYCKKSKLNYVKFWREILKAPTQQVNNIFLSSTKLDI